LCVTLSGGNASASPLPGTGMAVSALVLVLE
jgi:hypothetical protein